MYLENQTNGTSKISGLEDPRPRTDFFPKGSDKTSYINYRIEMKLDEKNESNLSDISLIRIQN